MKEDTQKSMFKKYNLGLIALLALPIALAFIANDVFNQTNKKISTAEYNIGEVAGAGAAEKIKDLSDDLPIFPDSGIISLKKSDNQVSIIMETGKSKEEVQNFYDDYFFKNNWEQSDLNIYTKDNYTLELNIEGSYVKINLQSYEKLITN